MTNRSGSATFTATLFQAPGKNATGIVVPVAVIERLDAGKKPPVRVTLNGHEYRTTIGVMGGEHLIPVSAAIRQATGLVPGDSINVELVVDTSERTVEIPADLAKTFAANPIAKAFFEKLSNSLQRYHIDNIDAAKAADTRERRIEKAVDLFLNDKQR